MWTWTAIDADTKLKPAFHVGTRDAWCAWPKQGEPDPEHISTSYVERSNLTMRMQSRRHTRLTNAFSKKCANLEHAVALHHMHYNYVRKHKTLGTTPAVAAGLATRPWTMADLVAVLEDVEQKQVAYR